MLKEADHQNTLIPRHNVFGAIAMVHIKIHNGHTLEAVALECVFGRNGDIVEKTKTHGFVATRMVTWRANGAESIFQFTRNDCIGGIQGCASRAQCSFPCMCVHGGVWVKRCMRRTAGLYVLHQCVTQASERGHIHAAMGQFNVCQSGRCRLSAI